jgi:hypothetical protein
LRAGAGGKNAPLATEGRNNVQPDVQEHRGKTLVPEGLNNKPKPLTSTSRRATVEEVEDEDDLISFSPKAGPSRNKGKGLDPGNWGDVSSLHDFDEQELRAQREMLENYAEINRIIKQEEVTPSNIFSQISNRPQSSPKAATRKRSRSPKSKKSKGTKPQPPVVEFEDVPEIEVQEIEPVKLAAPAVAQEFNKDPEPKSGLSIEDKLTLLFEKISQLDQRQSAESASNANDADRKKKKSSATLKTGKVPISKPLPRENTPGRLAAENFFERALRGTPKTLARADPPPSDPSDGSSSSSDDGSSNTGSEGSGSTRSRASSPRLSSKRKWGCTRKQKMLLKPIPPARYNGEANANAIQHFARESKTYVKMGRVPEDKHIYFVSHYLDGKALDFYNQIVVPDEENWTLKHFFVELFEFCFPVDFRNNQRKRLNRCFQNGKEVRRQSRKERETIRKFHLCHSDRNVPQRPGPRDRYLG